MNKNILHILIAGSLLASPALLATDTEPTAPEPVTAGQKKEHAEVAKKQKKLARKLKNKATPNEIGQAKKEVQTERTDANKEDYYQKVEEEKK